MHVEFKGGRTYGFADVPQKAYLDLRDAASPGAHFNTNVRGKFSPLT